MYTATGQAIRSIRLLRNALALGLRRLRKNQSVPPPILPETARRYDGLLENAPHWCEAILQPYAGECRWSLAEVYNGLFETIDAEFYHCMIRSVAPRLIVEVGSGWATGIAARALARNGAGCIACIDPKPRCPLPVGVRHICARVEDAGLGVFDELAANDILFIDSSHTRAEAEYHVRHILPRLRSGVITHHHDILYPYSPRSEEEGVIWEFYAAQQARFEVLAGLAYAYHQDPNLLRRLVPSSRVLRAQVPGSLWARRRPDAGIEVI